jgi:hypothetical protein
MDRLAEKLELNALDDLGNWTNIVSGQEISRPGSFVCTSDSMILYLKSAVVRQ